MNNSDTSGISVKLNSEIILDGEKLCEFLIGLISSSKLGAEKEAQFFNDLITGLGKSNPLSEARHPGDNTRFLPIHLDDESVPNESKPTNLPDFRLPTDIVANRSINLGPVDTPCGQCNARKLCILKHMESDDSCLGQLVHRRNPLHKGDLLFMPGDISEAFYLVRSGSLKSTMLDAEGNGQVVSFHFPGDLLGQDGFQSGRHVYQVEVLETSSICMVPFRTLTEVSSQNTSTLLIYRLLMSEMADISVGNSRLLMVLARMHAEQRLACFLLDISRHMKDSGFSGLEFKLSMQRYDIANYLGLAVETVSRLFRHMEDENILQAGRHQIRILDMDRLQRIKVAEYKFSGLGRAA